MKVSSLSRGLCTIQTESNHWDKRSHTVGVLVQITTLKWTTTVISDWLNSMTSPQRCVHNGLSMWDCVCYGGKRFFLLLWRMGEAFFLGPDWQASSFGAPESVGNNFWWEDDQRCVSCLMSKTAWGSSTSKVQLPVFWWGESCSFFLRSLQ